MKCFALESFNLSCQAEHTKINSRLNFNTGLALIAFWTTHPWSWLACTHRATISAIVYFEWSLLSLWKMTRAQYLESRYSNIFFWKLKNFLISGETFRTNSRNYLEHGFHVTNLRRSNKVCLNMADALHLCFGILSHVFHLHGVEHAAMFLALEVWEKRKCKTLNIWGGGVFPP